MILAQGEALQSSARAAQHLWGDYALADPSYLALVPLALLALLWGRAHAARAFGRASVAPGVPRSLRQGLLWIPPVFQGCGLVLASVALARPLRSNEERDVTSEGVDIALLIDRSGSMRFADLEPKKTRLDVVKDVVGEFAERRMSDRESAADNVALISFARYPRLLCPFTLDIDALQGFLGDVKLAEREEEDGTAIGVALAKAVAVLKESDAKSRICVLLTDGQNNVQDITPAKAAELAAEERIKVYTVFAARYNYKFDPFQGWVATQDPVDTSDLEHMAELTGGRFFKASDRKGLAEIYAEIERLEKTPRNERRFEETFDLYTLVLVPAIACALVAQLSRSSWARRIP